MPPLVGNGIGIFRMQVHLQRFESVKQKNDSLLNICKTSRDVSQKLESHMAFQHLADHNRNISRLHEIKADVDKLINELDGAIALNNNVVFLAKDINRVIKKYEKLHKNELLPDNYEQELRKDLRLIIVRAQQSNTLALEDLNQVTVMSSGFIVEACIVFVLLFGLSITYLYTVNWYLANPIKQLAQTAKKISNGNLTQRAEIEQDGPIKELGDDFNNMMDILVESLREEGRTERSSERSLSSQFSSRTRKGRVRFNDGCRIA